MNRRAALAFRTFLAVVAIASLGGCGASPLHGVDASHEDLSKIKFDLARIHPDGLRGPPDGLVTVAYVFSVPADEGVYQELRRIDPDLRIAPEARGRDGGGPGLAVCIGSTARPNWRDVLGRLSGLSYVKEIRECFFE